MIQYTWKIEQLDYDVSTENQANVVNNIHWRLLGTDGTYNGQTYGNLGVSLDVNKPFIAYANLTQEQVIDWLETNLGNERINDLKEAVKTQIETQANPKTGSGLPWEN